MQDDERPTREEARLHVLLVGGAPHVVFKLWLHFIAAKVQFRGASFIARLDQGLALICLVFAAAGLPFVAAFDPLGVILLDRKSTRLNSSHVAIQYSVSCYIKQ